MLAIIRLRTAADILAVPFPMADLQDIVTQFAAGIRKADDRGPVARNARSKVEFAAGIGPHSEAQIVELAMRESTSLGDYALSIPYPESPRQRCDLCIGRPERWEWAIEAKMLRFLGDNGKLNDSILMHILSPYPSHRSAVTDCQKLARSTLGLRKAVLIFGFDAEGWPLEPAIKAFELLAGGLVRLGARCEARFNGLRHPVHQQGSVIGWQIHTPLSPI